MQVDRNNFSQLLPTILKQVAECDFIAFDCQFSGLITCLDKIQGSFPNHIEFYERIKQTANNFVLFQIGLTLFMWNGQNYLPKPYNFYIEPKNQVKDRNKIMLCEVQSMEFLVQNGMNFTRVFTSGIKYNRIYNEIINPPHRNMANIFNSENYFNNTDKKIVEEIQQMLQKLFLSDKMQTVINFHTKSILAYFRKKTTNATITDKGRNMKQFEFIVRKMKKIQTTMIQEKEKEEKKVQEDKGFQTVVQQIIQRKKPIVGHFPNLDLGLIYNHFIDKLPSTYEIFCQKLQQYFPYIFDTKILCKKVQNGGKNLRPTLSALFNACSNDYQLKKYANLQFDKKCPYLNVESNHQAGYDSFMTGCAFVGIVNCLKDKVGRIIFEDLQEENKVIFSMAIGEVKIKGKQNFCEDTAIYDKTIVIGDVVPHAQQQKIAKQLTKYGTLKIYEDHENLYYIFEQKQDIGTIIAQNHCLRPYCERNIIKYIDTFKTDEK